MTNLLIHRLFYTSSFALAIGSCVPHAAAPPIVPSAPASLTVRIDTIVERARRELHFTGVSLVVMRGHDVLVSKGYGLANVRARAPATDRTVYAIGSLSKQITAAAIMTLVEQGRVQLDAPIAAYLPELPIARNSDLSVRTLLHQSSGISVFDDYPEVDVPGVGSDSTTFPFPRVVAMIGAHPPLYAPNTWWSYNNSNYTLLAAIIERVTGLTYDEYLARALFRPLGMSRTRSCSPTVTSERDRAVGYEEVAESLAVRSTREWLVPSMTGPGGLCSNVIELALWTRALVEGRAVTPASYRIMTSPHTIDAGVAHDPFTPPYGFGLSLLPLAGQPAVWHTGVREGFMSVLAYLPEQDVVVAIAANTRHTLIDDLAGRIVRELVGLHSPQFADIRIPAEEIARTIGHYDDVMFTLNVLEEGGQLIVEVPPLGVRERLRYQGGHLFVATGPRELRFLFDAMPGPAQRVDWEWSELRAYGRRTPSAHPR